MTNKNYDGGNMIKGHKGNDIHKMPTTHTSEVKHGMARNVSVTKTSPQSDTENVRVSKDTVTDAVFKGDGV